MSEAGEGPNSIIQPRGDKVLMSLVGYEFWVQLFMVLFVNGFVHGKLGDGVYL